MDNELPSIDSDAFVYVPQEDFDPPKRIQMGRGTVEVGKINAHMRADRLRITDIRRAVYVQKGRYCLDVRSTDTGRVLTFRYSRSMGQMEMWLVDNRQGRTAGVPGLTLRIRPTDTPIGKK